uniref:Uncharacterized protein n=1 Tax=Romanomermis culicivorax TaxID=13658 RepID=A0A915KC75_ROMCU
MNNQNDKTWFYSTPCISQHHENPIRLDDNSLWMINGVDEADKNCGNGSGANVSGGHMAPFPPGPPSLLLLEEDLQKVCQRSQTTTAALSPISSPDIKRSRAAFFDHQRQRYDREWRVQPRTAASGVKQQVRPGSTNFRVKSRSGRLDLGLGLA